MTRVLVVWALCLGQMAEARSIYALVIGNNAPPISGPEGLRGLRYADDDAARYAQFFGRLTDRTHVLTVLDADSQRRYPDVAAKARPPTRFELMAAVDDLAARVRVDATEGARPVVYVTFSGHGVKEPDGGFFLALEDGKLTRDSLYDDVLSKLDIALVHVFIDACHAQGLVGGRGALGPDIEVPKADVAIQTADLAFQPRLPARFSRVGIITASTVDQQAHEWSRFQAGVFTHELLSGLSGPADVNGDGAIEYSELQAFIASANRDIADPRAAPRVIAVAPLINVHAPVLVLEELRETGFLSGLFGFGHFYVERENGQRLVDAHLAPDQEATIALPAGRVFLIAGGEEAELEIREGNTIATRKVRLGQSRAAARGSVEAELSRALFKTPYGEIYYQGYTDRLGDTPVIFRDRPVVRRKPFNRRKALGVTAVSLAGVTVTTAGVLAAFAGGTWDLFAQSQRQRFAFETRQRATELTAAAVTTGVVALAFGVVAWRLLPTRTEVLTVSAHVSPGGGGFALQGSW